MEHRIPARTSGEERTLVTPGDAGWTWLRFEVRVLEPGRTWRRESGDHELALVFQRGDAEVAVGGERWTIQGRADVFHGMAHVVYVPPDHAVEVTPSSEVEVAIGGAPADGKLAPRLIRPEDVKIEMRGGHNVTRQVSHLLDPDDAEHLLCVEVYTPSGNWSSYPPHRHDVQDPPNEVALEEIYHHRVAPSDGWMVQRLYDDARELDELMLIHDRDTVLVPSGYHPYAATPGYDGYYLNFLAGETPLWIVRDEPQLAWVRDAWAGREDGLRLPLEGTGRGSA